MKNYLILLLVLGLSACQSAQSSQPAVTHHTGLITSSELLAKYPNFAQEYQRYTPSEKEISAIKVIEGKSLMVLLGTWCHDSEREVPRLLKTIDKSGVKGYELKLLAVDFNKQEPSGLYLDYQLRYTPTFVLEENGQPVARVIERPKVTIAEDLAALVVSF